MQPRSPLPLPAFVDPSAAVWRVNVRLQEMEFVEKGSITGQTPVSTSLYGTGNEVASFKTPLGWHRAVDIIGRGAPAGQRFVSREPIGEPLSTWTKGQEDAILSRIVVLEGLEPELNCNTRARCIYIHGTNQEERLGTPASHGCIRVGNKALIDWINQLRDLPLFIYIGD
jgi:L,D-transpeptidase YbiS